MSFFSPLGTDAPTQIQENCTDRALDSCERTTEVLEIPSIDSDWEKPRDTDTGCILSKKISDTQTKTCWFYSD